MKFFVEKASLEGTELEREVPPCDDARREKIQIVHHGKKVREFERWVVEINSLRELIMFMRRNKRIIIERCRGWFRMKPKIMGEILIYDDWIE